MPKMQLQNLKAKKQGKKSQSYKGIIGLIRPFNCFLASLATIAGFNLVSTPDFTTLLAAITVFIITGAGNVINDFFDINRDNINKKYRPIVSGMIKPGYAVALSIILFSLGIFFAYLVNIDLFFLSILVSIVLILYSGVVKEFKFFGNIIVSFLVGLTFIAGTLAAGYWYLGVSLASLAFVVNWSREIFKDLEEKSREKWTLAALLGEDPATLVADGLLFWAILAAIAMSYVLGWVQRFLFLLAIVSWVATFISFRKYRMAQKFVKIGMSLVILALLLPKNF